MKFLQISMMDKKIKVVFNERIENEVLADSSDQMCLKMQKSSWSPRCPQWSPSFRSSSPYFQIKQLCFLCSGTTETFVLHIQ